MFYSLQSRTDLMFEGAAVVKIRLTAYDCSSISDILEVMLDNVKNYEDKYFLHTLHKQFHSAEEFWLNEATCGENIQNEDNSDKQMEFISNVMNTEFGMCLVIDRKYYHLLKFYSFRNLIDVDDDTWRWFLTILFPMTIVSDNEETLA